MHESDEFLELLRQEGIVHHPDARLTALTGGVSCEIYLVEDGDERFVVKRALAKLKVKADWFADVGRNRHEWEFIRYVARFLPDGVPALRHHSATGNYFAMEYLGGQFQNWKQLLLAGQADAKYAARAGNLLAQIHRHSAGDAEAMRLFDTTANFFQLRIEPYLLAAGAKHAVLRPLFEAEAARLGATRECLVHGDFSPKNILVSRERMVLLDCEVAWYGDPAFDLAFMLNHFFLKALQHAPRESEPKGVEKRPANHANDTNLSETHSSDSCDSRAKTAYDRFDSQTLRSMVEEFWSAYQEVRPAEDLDQRVARLLLMLLLARVDGKSPVEYLDAARQEFVRRFVQEELPAKDASLRAVADSWFGQLHQIEK